MITFEGYIRDITYSPQFSPGRINTFDFADFNINNSDSFGIINLGANNTIAYSKWVTPKRTRSFPFARIYNTYHLNTSKFQKVWKLAKK